MFQRLKFALAKPRLKRSLIIIIKDRSFLEKRTKKTEMGLKFSFRKLKKATTRKWQKVNTNSTNVGYNVTMKKH